MAIDVVAFNLGEMYQNVSVQSTLYVKQSKQFSIFELLLLHGCVLCNRI